MSILWTCFDGFTYVNTHPSSHKQRYWIGARQNYWLIDFCFHGELISNYIAKNCNLIIRLLICCLIQKMFLIYWQTITWTNCNDYRQIANNLLASLMHKMTFISSRYVVITLIISISYNSMVQIWNLWCSRKCDTFPMNW